MTVTNTNTNATELNETLLHQVVAGRGSAIKVNTGSTMGYSSDIVLHELSATVPTNDAVMHDRSGK